MSNKLLKTNVFEQANTFNLETERLNLMPLNAKNLTLAIDDYSKMQVELGLNAKKTFLDDEEMLYAMKVRLARVLENEENYIWFTNWAIIQKEENAIIGYIILKGLPNKSGDVIIGYDIDEDYRRKGYATEAIKGLIQWIFLNPNVITVIADTETTNIPSYKLLEKLGAVRYKESSELIWWKIDRESYKSSLS